jgi:hypothetical protein
VVAQLHAALPPAHVAAPHSLQQIGGDSQKSNTLEQPANVAAVDALQLQGAVLLQVHGEHGAQVPGEAAVAVAAPCALKLGRSFEDAVILALQPSSTNKRPRLVAPEHTLYLA